MIAQLVESACEKQASECGSVPQSVKTQFVEASYSPLLDDCESSAITTEVQKQQNNMEMDSGDSNTENFLTNHGNLCRETVIPPFDVQQIRTLPPIYQEDVLTRQDLNKLVVKNVNEEIQQPGEYPIQNLPVHDEDGSFLELFSQPSLLKKMSSRKETPFKLLPDESSASPLFMKQYGFLEHSCFNSQLSGKDSPSLINNV